jgi:tetrahydrodipicolinate N-succinyltransferase
MEATDNLHIPTKKQIWYNKRKTDEAYMERMRESRRKYYEKNKVAESEKALDRYYTRIAKAALNEVQP